MLCLFKKGSCRVLDSPIFGKSYNAVPTVQKMKLSIKDFFSKCDQIRRKVRIWSYLLKKSFMENFIFCAVSHLSLPQILFPAVNGREQYSSSKKISFLQQSYTYGKPCVIPSPKLCFVIIYCCT